MTQVDQIDLVLEVIQEYRSKALAFEAEDMLTGGPLRAETFSLIQEALGKAHALRDVLHDAMQYRRMQRDLVSDPGPDVSGYSVDQRDR